jgi:hypothetical protein
MVSPNSILLSRWRACRFNSPTLTVATVRDICGRSFHVVQAVRVQWIDTANYRQGFKTNVRVRVMICGGGKADSCVVGTEGLLVTLNVAHSATVVICWCLLYGYTVPDEKLLYWPYRRTRHSHDYNLFNVTLLSLWGRHYSRDRAVTREVKVVGAAENWTKLVVSDFAWRCEEQ